MFARLLALCCLSIPVCSQAATLAVYLKTPASQTVRPLDPMKRELARLMRAAGYELEWRGSDSHIDTEAFLAVVELRGGCEAPTGSLPANSTLRETAELASTFVSGGRVLPFSWINCGNVIQLLAPTLADQPGARADFILGRAVARLIAHELYHILMQSREHTRNGISKPSLSAGDLSAERFEFEPEALAQLQAQAARSDGSTRSDAAIPAIASDAGSPFTSSPAIRR